MNKRDEQLAEQRRLDADYWNTRFVQYDTQARTALDRATQLVTVGLTVLVAAAAAFSNYGLYEILVAIPVAVVILWAVGVRMLHEHNFLAAYKDFAEQQLAAMGLGRPDSRFAIWHSFGGRAISSGLSNLLFYLVLIVITSTLAIGAPLVSWMARPDYWLFLLIESICVIAFLVLIAIAARLSWRQVALMYEELGRDILQAPAPGSRM